MATSSGSGVQMLMAAKDGCESLTSDETIHDDELVAVPKRKRIRKRAMDELAYLKGQVAEYTQQLHALQAMVPDLAAVSQWEGRSRRQAAERAAVEQENHKLKAALEGQLKIVESLVKIVTKRPKLAEEMYLDVGARHDALPADPSARVARMHAMVDAEYPKWECHFITKRLLDPPVATAPAIETNVQYVDERIGFDCIMRRALNVNVHDCASILWTMYFENMDITLETAILRPIQRIDDHTVYYHHLLHFKAYEFTVHNQVVCKRYTEPDRVVIVFQSVVGDALYPFPANAYVAHETAW
ncbi:hypothetical protein, variant 2 [Aphanomyces astaci]|nr:hypothetical protein, variant 2 [Aphanomyces astaci]ETV85297.1 hypothetical protein, variant 2 [Aphanomyces astaci]|eukprot:XP_009825315.1 hypothetical protein, variant 2 [Aphanomyces astaci]